MQKKIFINSGNALSYFIHLRLSCYPELEKELFFSKEEKYYMGYDYWRFTFRDNSVLFRIPDSILNTTFHEICHSAIYKILPLKERKKYGRKMDPKSYQAPRSLESEIACQERGENPSEEIGCSGEETGAYRQTGTISEDFKENAQKIGDL